MSEIYYQRTLDNGLTLLGEKMPGVQSAAMTLLVCAGSAEDPQGKCGAATVLSDLVLRGAGQRKSRQLTDYLDSLGLQRSVSVGVYHTRFGCAALAANVMQGLDVYADILRRPHLLENDFAASRDLSLQALAGLDDDPRQKLLIALREWHFPSPLGRNSMGNKTGPRTTGVGEIAASISPCVISRAERSWRWRETLILRRSRMRPKSVFPIGRPGSRRR